MDSSLREQIVKAIENETIIRVRLYALLSQSEEELNYIITSILKKYDCETYLGPLYTSIKELALNGVKANIKRILFSEEDISLDDDLGYEKGMKLFRSKLSEGWVSDYATKSKEKGLFVDVSFNFNQHRILVEVHNNSPLSEKEDKRIRFKFKKGSQYDNIAEFYMDTQDNAEGAGMGIALILMLLKAEGIDHHMFTIRSDYKTHTIARLEFPLHDEYKSERAQYAAGDVEIEAPY